MLPASRHDTTPARPVEPRNFRPAREWTVGQVHRVEVVGIVRFGGDSFLACRGLDDPSSWFEAQTPRPIEEGTRGVVRCLMKSLRVGPAWNFTPGEVEAPGAAPAVAPPAGPAILRVRYEGRGGPYGDQAASVERLGDGRREHARFVGGNNLESAIAWLLSRGGSLAEARELVRRAHDDRAQAWAEWPRREGGIDG